MDEWDGSSLLVIVNNHIIYRAALRVLACLGDGRCLSVSGNHTFARHGDFAIFLPHDICLPVIHSLQRDCIRNRRSLAGIILASNLAATSAWILFPCPSTKSIVALIPSSHCSNLFIALLGTGPGVYVDLKTFKFPRSDHRIVGWRWSGHDVCTPVLEGWQSFILSYSDQPPRTRKFRWAEVTLCSGVEMFSKGGRSGRLYRGRTGFLRRRQRAAIGRATFAINGATKSSHAVVARNQCPLYGEPR